MRGEQRPVGIASGDHAQLTQAAGQGARISEPQPPGSHAVRVESGGLQLGLLSGTGTGGLTFAFLTAASLVRQLEVAQGDLTILVPAESVELIGVRDVVDEAGLKRVFDVLRAPLTEEPTNWSRRFKANQEKIASGDVIKVAEVVRDLSRRDTDRGLSAGEKRMLSKARQILVSELALAEKTAEDQAESKLDEVLASGTAA